MLDDAPAPGTADAGAAARFRACRWHEGQEGKAEHCSHPDVLPYAGRNGFNPEAWCPECSFYKARRNTRRRNDSLHYEY